MELLRQRKAANVFLPKKKENVVLLHEWHPLTERAVYITSLTTVVYDRLNVKNVCVGQSKAFTENY